MVKLSSLLVLATLLLPLTSWAQAPACYDFNKVFERVREFKIDFDSFPEEQWQPCNPESYNVKLMRAFDFLDNLKFDTFTPNVLFMHPYNDYHSKRVMSRVARTKYQPDISCTQKQCPSAAVFGGSNMILFKRFFETDMTELERAMILVHEGRHTHAEDSGHTTCSRGFLKGMDGVCDSSIKAGGAYGFEVDFSAKAYFHGKNLSDSDRLYFREAALYRLETHINTIDVDLGSKEVALIHGLENDKAVYVTDGRELFPTPDRIDPGGLFYIRNGLYKNIPSPVYQHVSFGTQFSTHTGWAYRRPTEKLPNSSYKTPVNSALGTWPGNKIKELRGIQTNQIGSSGVMLFANRLEIFTEGQNLVALAAPRGIVFSNFVDLAPNCQDEPSETIGLIRDEKGGIWKIDTTSQKPRLSRTKCQMPEYLKNYMKLNGIAMGLSVNNQLLFFDDKGEPRIQLNSTTKRPITASTLMKMRGLFFQAFTR